MQLAEKHAPSAAELLLLDLEQRQDQVLEQLDALDRRICEVLESIVPGSSKASKKTAAPLEDDGA
jgi:hypothetical protein